MRRGSVRLKTGDRSNARRLHTLITANLEEGHLLPRTFSELVVHAERFTVAVKGRRIVGCAELAPLSPSVAEVRSLAVDASARGSGVGTQIVEELCAFTHAPGYFIQMGFSIVPHNWLLEKVFTDCLKCPLFRRCGQYAMVVPLDEAYDGARDKAPLTPSIRYA